MKRLLPVAAAVTSVTAGGAAFAVTQHVTWLTGAYWAVATATTVGYGDVTPHNTAGRVVAVAVMLTGVPSLAAAVAVVTGGHIVARLHRRLALIENAAGAAHRITAATHEAVTGAPHPDAPERRETIDGQGTERR